MGIEGQNKIFVLSKACASTWLIFKLEIMTYVPVIFTKICKMSNTCTSSFGRYIKWLSVWYTMYVKIYFLFELIFYGKVVVLKKIKTHLQQFPQKNKILALIQKGGRADNKDICICKCIYCVIYVDLLKMNFQLDKSF